MKLTGIKIIQLALFIAASSVGTTESLAAGKDRDVPPRIALYAMNPQCGNRNWPRSLASSTDECLRLPAILNGSDIAGRKFIPTSDGMREFVVLTPDGTARFHDFTMQNYGSSLSWSVEDQILGPITILGVITTGILPIPPSEAFKKELLNLPDLSEPISDCHLRNSVLTNKGCS